jgi:hypothetical protein
MTEKERLQDLTARLRNRISAAPALSYTARAAQRQLDAFERPGAGFTTAQKIAALTSTLRDFTRGLQFTDPTLEHPGDRRPGGG